jgi:hypothetical protein
VTRDVYTRLVALRDASGQSFGKLVQQMLGVVETDYESVRKRGFDAGHLVGAAEGRRAGYLEALRLYCVTYSCNVCGLPMRLRPGSRAAKVAAEALEELRWGHRHCHQRRRLEGRPNASQD